MSKESQPEKCYNIFSLISSRKGVNKLKFINTLALVLVVVGGLNWGLVGLFDFDLVATIFGDMSMLSRVVYILVGVSAVVVALNSFKGGSSSSSAM